MEIGGVPGLPILVCALLEGLGIRQLYVTAINGIFNNNSKKKREKNKDNRNL